jgi:hypothetical protein
MEDRCFTEEFVRDLSPNDAEAWVQILDRLRTAALDRDSYPDVYGFLLSFSEARHLPVEVPTPVFEPERDVFQLADLIDSLEKHVGPALSRQRIQEAVQRSQEFYQTKIGGAFVYTFLEDDYRRLVALVDRIGTLPRDHEQIDADHRDRLLKRTRQLRQRLHKRMSSLDMFWGLVGEAGVVLGKLGQEAMPLAEDMCEIIRITMRTHARAEGLPGATENPLLSEPAQVDNAHANLSFRFNTNEPPIHRLAPQRTVSVLALRRLDATAQ